MNDYNEEDIQDPDRIVVRPKGMKNHTPFSYCKWAAGDWEARFFAFTETHDKQRERHVAQLVDNPTWFKWRAPKVDKRVAVNRPKGDKKKRKAKS